MLPDLVIDYIYYVAPYIYIFNYIYIIIYI